MNDVVPDPIPYFLMGSIPRGIITGRYPPGSPLREKQLEAEYGASRGPLREALRLLQLRGIVSHEPRRGFRVREYSAEMIGQIYRLRGLLERHSIEALAGHPLDQLIPALRAANQTMRQHFEARNIEGYLDANIAFHEAILDATRNEPLRKSIEVLNEMAQPIRYALLASRFEKSRLEVATTTTPRASRSSNNRVSTMASAMSVTSSSSKHNNVASVAICRAMTGIGSSLSDLWFCCRFLAA